MSLVPAQLPAVLFPEVERARQWDLRRWQGGERNTRYGASPIAGRGSFATQRIERAMPVMVREPLSGNYPVNHSPRPNTARAINRAGLFALRDIQSGEEITEDYRFLPYFGQRIPPLPEPLRLCSVPEYIYLLQQHGFTFEPEPGPEGSSIIMPT